jgi:hypothetical protein
MAKMNQLIVAYGGMSSDYSAPGDRRRFAGYALRNHIQLDPTTSKDADALVLTLGADISQWRTFKEKHGVLILDIVDSYLDESLFSPKRILRGLYKSSNGQFATKRLSYTKLLREILTNADAVVCASIEQREKLLKLNSNVHAIVDCFDELSESDRYYVPNQNTSSIMWEGFPDNLKHLGIMKISNQNLKFEIVSLRKIRRIAHFNRETDTENYLKSLRVNYELTPWTLTNLKSAARRSMVGVIPIDIRSPMAWNKSENKLLGMWSLGLPVLLSPTPSYTRVVHEANLSECLVENSDWNQRLIDFVNQPESASRIAKIGYDFAKAISNSSVVDRQWKSVFKSVGLHE